MKSLSSSLVAIALSFLSTAALAETYGAVKVECFGNCSQVNLGQICDGFYQNSEPTSVGCDDTAVGSGSDFTCSGAQCRQYGALVRSDLLSAYCDDGAGYDAVVTCRSL
jgi:hypothetical protein